MNVVEQAGLDALPNGAVIKTEHGIYMRNKPRLFPDEWCWLKQGNVETYPYIRINKPATVLYDPNNPDAAVFATEEDHAESALQANDIEVRATTNRVAKVILEEVEPGFDWATADEAHRELYREVARAAIQAMMSE